MCEEVDGEEGGRWLVDGEGHHDQSVEQETVH